MTLKTASFSVVILALICGVSAAAQSSIVYSSSPNGAKTTTSYGNNLSYPVLFAEGYGITGLPIPESTRWDNPNGENPQLPTAGDATGLRPFAGEQFTAFPWLVTPYVAEPEYYAQNTENTWRAEWTVGLHGTAESVLVDWGDNLVSQSWTATQPVRVETVLRQSESMIGYPMKSLLGSRRSEILGTTGDPELSLGRTVYSITAHLTIQKYDEDWENVIENGCSVDKNVYTVTGDGPGGYAAEINVSGVLIYGYNWMLSQCSAAPDTTKEGHWRVKFQLDDDATVGGETVTPNVKIVGVADISSSITQVGSNENSSWLDIEIVSNRPTGGKGRK